MSDSSLFIIFEIKFGAYLGTEAIDVPAAPAVEATANANAIVLTWAAVETATSYNVYQGEEKLANVTELTYTVEGLEFDTEYCFTITALNGDAESDKSAAACAKTEKAKEEEEEEEDDNNDDGVEELSSSLSIYPNPVNDKLYIETEVEIENVAIYTITGVMVGQQTTDNGQQTLTIDLSELNSGIYFIKISTDNGEIVKRIVKRI